MRFGAHESRSSLTMLKSIGTQVGAIAQLGERIVRNDEVVGSIPTSSTIFQRLTGTDFKVRFAIFGTMRSSVRSHHFSPTYKHGFCDYVSTTFHFSSRLLTVRPSLLEWPSC